MLEQVMYLLMMEVISPGDTRSMWMFRKDMAETLTLHLPIDHALDLAPGFNLPYRQIFLSIIICSSTKHITKKNDDGLWLGVDYWAHNQAMMKNWYPLPPILIMLDRTSHIRITFYQTRYVTSTTLQFAHSSSTESSHPGWLTYQLQYYKATIPISGVKSSADQQRLKRGMTLPQVTHVGPPCTWWKRSAAAPREWG